MACNVYSERTGLCLLSAAVFHDRGLCDDCGTGNGKQWHPENAGLTGQPAYAFYRQILCAGVLPVHGNGCIPCSIRNSRAVRHAHDGDYGNIARSLFTEMVCWFIPYHAALCSDDVGDYRIV